MKSEISISPAAYAMYYVIIAVSSVFVLLPAARAFPFAKVAAGLMVLALLATSIRSAIKTGQAKMTLPQIHSQAKAGRKFAIAIETAAVVAALLAFWMTI
jgi:hypothetical protein